MASELIELPDAELQPVSPEAAAPIRRDVRSAMMSLPVPEMQAMLAEWKDRRDAFRSWLLPQLKPGIHFGYVPGCAPRFDSSGNLLVWNSKKSANDVVPPEQWQAKPSLYKAGAQFLADLMNLVPVFDADLAAWEQLGKPGSTFVFRCRLFPKGAEQRAETLLGEGRGCRKVGQKGGDENNAIKMAQKAAMCDAILNGYGLADLFTQDMEDHQPEPQPNPEANADAPRTQPRGKRVEPGELQVMFNAWKRRQKASGASESKESLVNWATAACSLECDAENVTKAGTWTRAAFDAGIQDLKGYL